MNKRLANALKFIAFVGVGVGILYLMYRSQQAAYLLQCQLDGVPEDQCSLLDKLAADFRSASPFYLFLTLLAFCVSNLSRALRWNMMLRTFGNTPKLSNAFLTINLGYFANLGFPRLGEILRPATMARYENIALERVVGTVVVERMVDVIFILIATALALVLGKDVIMDWVLSSVDVSKFASLPYILGIGGALGCILLYLLWHQRQRIMATKIGGKIMDILKGFGEGIQTALRVKSPALFLFHSVNIWVMYFLMTWFTILAFKPTEALSPVAALVTFVSGGWGIVIPSPGGMGTYHFLTGEALQLYGVSALNAFSWSNISFFTIQIGCNVLIGLVALLLLPVINKGYAPERVG
ncbi:lysylphosphatidylglycerol synthase transmembrane domain-containing protein [Lewinella sp. 4G2]|uniref:lysylphosphatidylglycerol synthase transmembrane domain-containing protein n=1 Tax=Lewinella sp. 4G2 TaxID=1803372 RepID=UPI0007B4E803|nr:lysylphosphatidylglycerol synthase transmembrane domain-containing protein [Lewinella sp. 4G2]OAV43272.1 hypothetical protein A3850_001620 [Lewinella sp. 4G2]